MVFFYILYIFSGVLKSFLLYYHIPFPVNLTLLSAIFLVIAIIFDIIRNGIKQKINKSFLLAISSILILYIWMIFSLLYTPSPNYSYIKTFYFLTNILAFIYPFIIKDFEMKSFVKYFILTTIFFSIFFLINYSKILKSYYTGESDITGLYLVLGTLLGISLMLLATSKEIIFSKRILNSILIFIILIMIFLLGARGPLFFSLGLIILYFFTNKYKIIYKKLSVNIIRTIIFSLIISIVGFSVIYLSFKNKIDPYAQRTFHRIEVMVTNPKNNTENSSVKVRLDQINYSLEKIFESPESFIIGQGIGSFNLLYKGEDGRGYPHNIFLEVWFELGIIGELFFLTFFAVLLIRYPRNKIISHWLLLFIILNMQKSNSLIDIRTYFAFFAMFLISQQNKKQNEQNENLSIDISTPEI